MIRRLTSALEIIGALITLYTLAHPNMSKINQAVGILMIACLLVIALAGLCLLAVIVRSQLKPPYV